MSLGDWNYSWVRTLDEANEANRALEAMKVYDYVKINDIYLGSLDQVVKGEVLRHNRPGLYDVMEVGIPGEPFDFLTDWFSMIQNNQIFFCTRDGSVYEWERYSNVARSRGLW